MKKILFIFLIYFLTYSNIHANNFKDWGSFWINTDVNFIYSDVELALLLERSTDPQEFNGMRVKHPDHHQVYVIENGKKRWIPNPKTYNNLFKNWKGIHVSPLVNLVPSGKNILDDALLIQGAGPKVYITDHGTKRHIITGDVMEKYYFDWKKIKKIPETIMKSIPTGDEWR